MNSNGVDLHLDDYPATLDLLAAIAGDRGDLSFDQLGYEVTEHGARVNWNTLTTAPLPANERALAHIAQGCMAIEARAVTQPRPANCSPRWDASCPAGNEMAAWRRATNSSPTG